MTPENGYDYDLPSLRNCPIYRKEEPWFQWNPGFIFQYEHLRETLDECPRGQMDAHSAMVLDLLTALTDFGIPPSAGGVEDQDPELWEYMMMAHNEISRIRKKIMQEEANRNK